MALLGVVPGVCHSQVHMAEGDRSAGVDSARRTATAASYDPSLGGFPRQLVSNAVGLFARGNLEPLVVGAGLTMTARAIDDDIQSALANQASGVGEVGDVIVDPVVIAVGIVGLFAAGQLTTEGRFRAVTFDLAQGFLISGALTTGLKRAVGRERPDTSNARSFPSGHSSMSFTIATVLARHLGPKAGVPAAVVATFVALSRVEDNEHFLSDVVAGVTLGIIVGRTVTAHLGRDPTTNRLSFSPVAAPRGGGVLVTYRW